ncbi:ammonium transporter [Candidatus Xianfuyuplasma coldseepsis]|uniref:Ammonium transporter n=1 Tax=Candidatus Xianfuyuplasma coldseepsis TaxID=2782163 RepID=A0A7L7KS73_9MOLU|nr:ammonium transporter [Xianfuyuplasma coldseepsis]QMS84638.1 ammonium transporter [Xianfuyuplasma coldseepsis]
MDYGVAIDTMWVLVATALVFFMQAGFAMVETGFTRAKNAGNIIMKNMMDFAVGSVIYFVFGFSIMFGDSIGGLFGEIHLFSNDLYEHLGLTIPQHAFMIFQTVFAATAATIVSGAMAERTKFASYLVFSFVITLVIYPVVGHWVWGGGWLSELGFHDFAGSTVVHSVGGWAALMGAFILGPRIGKYNQDGSSNKLNGHSLTLGALGVFILWFGWFGFNPGSTLSGQDVEAIALIFMTTNLAAAAGAISAMFITWVKDGKPDVGMTLNGALGGLVAITAGTDAVSTVGALGIGLIAGIVIVYGSELVERTLHVDDPVGAVAVHGLCGATGTLLVGVFATEGGLLASGSFALLGVQALGVVAVAGWTLSTSFILFKTIDIVLGLRVSKEEELTGLDLLEHGLESSYPDFEYKKDIVTE